MRALAPGSPARAASRTRSCATSTPPGRSTRIRCCTSSATASSASASLMPAASARRGSDASFPTTARDDRQVAAPCGQTIEASGNEQLEALGEPMQACGVAPYAVLGARPYGLYGEERISLTRRPGLFREPGGDRVARGATHQREHQRRDVGAVQRREPDAG